MSVATNAGTKLYWRVDGNPTKPRLLLLNSIGTDVDVWSRLVPLLSPDFHILRMDARGHGRSDAPPADYDLGLLAADVVAVMDAAGFAAAAVCGLSLGGMVAMRFALDHPERVTALVLACTSAAMDRAAWDDRIRLVRAEGMIAIADLAMERFFSEAFRSRHADIVASIRSGLLATDAAGYAASCAAIRDMDLLDRIAGISAPTLVLSGTRDRSTPFAGHGSAIVDAIANARAGLLDAGHLASLEDPAGMAAALATFLGGLDVAQARDTLFAAGLVHRKAVLGDDWVDRSLAERTPFNTDFQAMITRIAWQEIWGRPGLDHRTRRLLVIAITAALGRWEEFCLHVKSGLEQNGFTEDELKETLMQTAIYAGVPAANTAFAKAATILKQLRAKPNA